MESRIEIEFLGGKYDAESHKWIERYIEKVIIPAIVISEGTLKEISEMIKEGIEMHLYRGLDYFGNTVAPLKSSTIKRKGHNKVFFDTGELYQSVANRTEKEYAEVFLSAGRSEIAKYLQSGTSRMAARPFFGLSERMKAKIDIIMRNQRSKST